MPEKGLAAELNERLREEEEEEEEERRERRLPREEKTSFWEILFKAAGLTATLGAVIWGVVQFGLEHEASRQKQALDMRAPLRKRQMDTYMEAAEYAAQVAWLDANDPRRKVAYDRFNTLYIGQLSVVEEKEVLQSSTEFRQLAVKVQADMDQGKPLRWADQLELMKLSRKFARACRAELAETWKVDDLKGHLVEPNL